MRTLIFRWVLPLTIISFHIFTKWWYVLPVDAPQTVFTGFPFAYAGSGWHTSLSLQIFVVEFTADLAFYFLFWFALIIGINTFAIKIKAIKVITMMLWLLSFLTIGVDILIAVNLDNIFYVKRPYDWKIIETGYKLMWTTIQRPSF